MAQQSTPQNNNQNAIRPLDADFHDAHEESPFADAPNSPQQSLSTSDHDTNTDQESTITLISDHTPDSPSSPSSSGLRHRRILSPRSCKQVSHSQFFKNNPDGLIDFDPHNTNTSVQKKYGHPWNLKDNNVLDSTTSNPSFSSDSRQLNDITDANSEITVNSPNSAPDLVSILAELAIKVIGYQTKFLTSSVTFPIWLLHSSYLLLTDPFGAIKLARSYMLGYGSGIWGICYSVVKLIKYLWNEKHESTLKYCSRIGWGLLWFAYCGFILVGLLVPALFFGGMMMRWIVEEPVRITEKLVFDYTKDTPMAFVPIISCPESSVLVHHQNNKIESFDESRVIPFDHKVQTTVSLTLPESEYNINLGIFQVRLDFLSSDGKLLGSTRQPCMLHFKSQPIRLLSTFLKLASLLTGYSSETQTLDMKFRGYTEKDVHTSCTRVVIEQRAEFARRGGVPEIYSASLKIESQLPFVKRMLWYSKWLIYMWFSIMTYIIELLFTLLCCRPIIFPWERSVHSSGSSNNNVSHNNPSGST